MKRELSLQSLTITTNGIQKYNNTWQNKIGLHANAYDHSHKNREIFEFNGKGD